MLSPLVIVVRNTLGYACRSLAGFFEELSRRLIACPDCGRSRFYGEACVKHE